MKNLFFICLMLFGGQTYGQHQLCIVVKAGAQAPGPVYLAGNFNNWDPSGSKMAQEGNYFFYEKSLSKENVEFKFTRGSWEKVETSDSGIDIGNRQLRLLSDTTIYCYINGWKDQFTGSNQPPRHTAGPGVHIVDTAFRMSSLQRNRKIWIYLPPGYTTSKNRYPVLYMQDGQNLFDKATSGFGEWGIDEILDSLSAAGKGDVIVVGIESGSHRMTEYNPYDFADYGPGEGDKYVGFIVDDLKPYIDKKYKTLQSKENTFIAGSSMGGLISYYAAITHPATFGKAGVFSPSFWAAPEIHDLTDSVAARISGMYFFYMGEREGENMMPQMNKVISQLAKNSRALIYTVTDPEGRHNEATWNKWFAEFYLWAMSNGLNRIIR